MQAPSIFGFTTNDARHCHFALQFMYFFTVVDDAALVGQIVNLLGGYRGVSAQDVGAR